MQCLFDYNWSMFCQCSGIVEGDSNENNCHNSTACADVIAESQSSETTLAETTREESKVMPNSEEAAVPSKPTEETPRERIDFKVIYNKKKIDVSFDLDGTVAELKTHLQNIITVPKAMQKVMIKGLAKDEQTLRDLGVTSGNYPYPAVKGKKFYFYK